MAKLASRTGRSPRSDVRGRVSLAVVGAIVALAFLAALGLAVLVGGAAWLYERTASDAPLESGDRAALVTARDLLDTIDSPVDLDLTPERARRRKYFDGSVEVEYEFESGDGLLYVYCSISLEKGVGDASAVYQSQVVGTSIGVAVGASGVQRVDRDDLLAFGDRSKSQVLTLDGAPIGNVFLARKGTRVYALFFSGVYFDEPSGFRELMEPKLAAFERLVR